MTKLKCPSCGGKEVTISRGIEGWADARCWECHRTGYYRSESLLQQVWGGSFTKHDQGKVRYDLIPVETLKALATILTHGAAKYEDNNWMQCEDTSRYYSALMRHLEAWRGGEQLDPDSGESHLAHVLTNAAFLHYLETTK